MQTTRTSTLSSVVFHVVCIGIVAALFLVAHPAHAHCGNSDWGYIADHSATGNYWACINLDYPHGNGRAVLSGMGVSPAVSGVHYIPYVAHAGDANGYLSARVWRQEPDATWSIVDNTYGFVSGGGNIPPFAFNDTTPTTYRTLVTACVDASCSQSDTDSVFWTVPPFQFSFLTFNKVTLSQGASGPATLVISPEDDGWSPSHPALVSLKFMSSMTHNGIEDPPLPPGVTADPLPSCTSPCSTNIVFHVSPSAPVGSYTIWMKGISAVGTTEKLVYASTGGYGIQFNITAAPPPTADLKIRNFTDNGPWDDTSVDISPGKAVELSWSSSSNATRCVGTNFFTGSGEPKSGTVVVSPGGDTTYTVTCYNGPGSGDPNGSDNAAVTVSGGPTKDPEVFANPMLVDYKATSAVSWKLNGHTGCSIPEVNGDTLGPNPKTLDGNSGTVPLYGETTYTITCTDFATVGGKPGSVKIRLRPRFENL